MRRLLLATIIGASTTAVVAEPYVNLTAGTRDETDSEERLPALGLTVDFGRDAWPVRPELGFSIGFDPLYGGDETEFFAGAVGYWDGTGSTRFHLGGGFSNVSSDWGANTGSSTGIFLHGGASWPARRHRIGVDVRYLDADDIEPFGTPYPVGYFQIAVLFQW